MSEEKKYRAIYIDDDKILLTVMTAYAQHTKHVDLIGCYLNPIEGIQAIDELKPEILFLDVQMKEADAFATIAALEHNPIIIIVSSHWETEDDLIAAGASCFLSKPLKGPDQIDAAVEKALAFDESKQRKAKKTIKLHSNQEVLPELYREKSFEVHFEQNESWADFISKFDQKYPSFFESLKADFETLTPTQLRICAYAKIGIKLKNMSNNMDQSLDAVEANIADIKVKLHMEPSDDLRDFLSIYN